MMPHPERRAEAALGGEDGKRMFTGLVEAPHERRYDPLKPRILTTRKSRLKLLQSMG